MRYAKFPGTGLDHRWRHVFAPHDMVEASHRGVPPPAVKRDTSVVYRWFADNYPDDPEVQWTIYGSIVAINNPDMALAFKIRWC
jgi:hypothetical protein